MKKFLLFTMVFCFLTSGLFGQTLFQQADSLYELRGENFNTNTILADSAIINEAISFYKKALESTTVDLEKEEITWKLMRAYYFKGRYTTSDTELKKKIYDMGKELGKKGLKNYPESVGINLFSAIVWGVWGEEYGILKAARAGVAGKIKERCEKVIEIDPEFDEAGGYRVLGRVYFKAPKIWPILRWPSKKKSLEILEKAYELAPGNLVTKQFLAEALYARDQKDRAIEIVKEILAEDQVQEGIVEDAFVKNDVNILLKEWGVK